MKAKVHDALTYVEALQKAYPQRAKDSLHYFFQEKGAEEKTDYISFSPYYTITNFLYGKIRSLSIGVVVPTDSMRDIQNRTLYLRFKR